MRYVDQCTSEFFFGLGQVEDVFDIQVSARDTFTVASDDGLYSSPYHLDVNGYIFIYEWLCWISCNKITTINYLVS